MTKNPYDVLGVSQNASDDDIKKAYRDLTRKYHPDANVNNPLADLAEEKFKEVQEAYDVIMKEREQGGGYTGYGSGSSSGGYGDGVWRFGRRLPAEQRAPECRDAGCRQLYQFEALPGSCQSSEPYAAAGCTMVLSECGVLTWVWAITCWQRIMRARP